MKRIGLAAVGAVLILAGHAEAQYCAPQPTRVDPAYGNFTQTDWPEGSFSWVNNAMGAALSGVWANTDFDMWFVGDARPYGFETIEPIAVHFDGFSLQVMRPPGTSSLYGVWGSSSNDVWAVGFNGLILHWDGTQWVSIPSGTNENLYAVAGTASDDVWAAGSKAMRHWDGASWNDAPGFSPDRFDRVTGLAAITRSDALVATSEGCQRWDGTSWQTTACGVIGGRGVFAVNSNDIWVVGYQSPYCCDDSTAYRAHWDGTSWTTTSARGRYWGSIGGTGPNDIWIDGTLHYDGSTWTETICGPKFTSMSVSNNGAFMGVSYLGIEYFSGDDGWPFLGRTAVDMRALGGRDPANVWAVGYYGTVLRYDGSRWSGQGFPLPENVYLDVVFGSSASDIWASARPPFGGGGLFHFDGRAWTRVNFPGQLVIAGFSRAPNDAIVVDYGGPTTRNWHWDGATWFQIQLPIFEGDAVDAFWGTGPDDVWAGGGTSQSGGIFHWDGNSWQRMYRTTQGQISHITGSASNDVWFALRRFDNGTTALHWDGTSITESQTWAGINVMWPFSIAADSPNDVWFAVGDALYHYDGASWARDHANDLANTLWGVPGAGVFLITRFGQIYQHR